MNIVSRAKASIRILLRPVTRFLRPPPLSHLQPVSRRWGFERGLAIDRYFIDGFMSGNSADITGIVLEIKDRRYTSRFGQGVVESDVLDIDSNNRQANVIADLATMVEVESNRYDCFILNETLQFVFDLEAAVTHVHRVLKPGGVLLASVPTTVPLDNELPDTDYWRMTFNGCKRLFGKVFGSEQVQVEPYGNFVTCMAGLSGIAIEELPKEELNRVDEKYAQGVCIRAVKAGA